MEENGASMSFENVGHKQFLALGRDGEPSLVDTPTLFNASAGTWPQIHTSLPVDEAVLSPSQVAEFKGKGYIVIRKAVSADMVRDALRLINHQLGQPGCWEADGNPLNAAQLSITLMSSSGRTTVGKDILYKSPVFWSAVNVLLGSGNVAPFDGSPQVALRFPRPPSLHEADQRPGTRYHIDGMGQSRLCPFTILCGVALSDQTSPDCGNLHVFPGSHINPELQAYYRNKIQDADQNELDDNKPDLGDSAQVLLEKGDLVIAHQLLAHRIGLNISENIRYQLYYRLRHKDHASLKHRVPLEPWIEFAI